MKLTNTEIRKMRERENGRKEDGEGGKKKQDGVGERATKMDKWISYPI